jgi:ZIP family zinc transporter
MSHLEGLSPIGQALLATLFTWGVTALGAALVMLTPRVDQRLLDAMNGFAAGVMLAASYWSLLAPAIAMSEKTHRLAWVPATVGFLAGCAFLRSADKLLPHLHPGLRRGEAEGPRTGLRESALLVLAITLHNVPKGLAVGVAFGAADLGLPEASLAAAVALALGIGLQNFPEGVAVALPLRGLGMSRGRSFWYGQLSGGVEPIAGIPHLAALGQHRPRDREHSGGLPVMMVLDVALG